MFYERSIRLLADIDEIERSVAEAEIPKGKIRVSANIPVGRQLLLPIVSAFPEGLSETLFPDGSGDRPAGTAD